MQQQSASTAATDADRIRPAMACWSASTTSSDLPASRWHVEGHGRGSEQTYFLGAIASSIRGLGRLGPWATGG